MGIFLVYTLKSAACLSVFYLFYRLLLSGETFHRFNRIAILGILALSLLIPFCEINVEKHTEVQQTVLSLEQLLLLTDMEAEIPAVRTQDEKTIWLQLMALVYLAGIVCLVVRNMYSLVRLCRFLNTGERKKLKDNVILVIHDRNDLAPFSWLNHVVISRKDMDENGEEILIHELAHIRNRHSLDLLMTDVCILFQWFNPAAWLLKQELQNIHEYEADEQVIKEGVDAKQYQLLIIKKAVGTRLYSMANSFNHSKLKKRITMMLKEKSNPWAKLKYIYVLPLAAVAVTAFARPEVSNELKEISEVKVNVLNAIVAAKTKESVSDKSGSMALIHGTPTEKHEVDDPLSPVDVLDNAESSDSIVPSAQVGEPEKDDRSSTDKGDGKMLYIVDGQEVSAAILQAINTHHIKLMSVIKDKSAVEQYGEKAANGVVIVELKNEIETAGQGQVSVKRSWKLAQADSLSAVLVLLDGKEVSGMEVLNPEEIGSVNVYKPGSKGDIELFERYGDKAKNGIVLITSKGAIKVDSTALTINDLKGKLLMVKGRVIDLNKKPVAGATIIVSGTNVGTITDMEGNFALKTDEKDRLVVSYIGMKSAVVEASPQLTITLEADQE